MIEVVRIEAQWNGTSLEVRPVFGQGWEIIALESRPLGKRYSMPLTDLNSATSFQLEAAFYTAMRQVGDCWDVAQRTAAELTLDGLERVSPDLAQ